MGQLNSLRGSYWTIYIDLPFLIKPATWHHNIELGSVYDKNIWIIMRCICWEYYMSIVGCPAMFSYLLWEKDFADPWPCSGFSWPIPWTRCFLCAELSSFCSGVYVIFNDLVCCLTCAVCTLQNPNINWVELLGLTPALWPEALGNLIWFYSQKCLWHRFVYLSKGFDAKDTLIKS